MTDHDLPEQLSAYLDGELAPAEHMEVEALLRQRPELAQTLVQLRELGDEIRQLPTEKLGSDFAPRVLATVQQAARPAIRERDTQRNRLLAAAAALVALAACAIAIVAMRSGLDEIATSPAEKAVAAALAQADEPGEAAVIRLRLTKDAIRGQALDRALAAHGISSEPATTRNPAAADAAQAYRARAKTNPAGATAADVVFIEAPREQLEKALAAIAVADGGALALSPDGAVESKRPGLTKTSQAEGEDGGPGDSAAAAKTAGYSQHLPSRGFPLAKPPASSPASEQIQPAQSGDTPVRVLVIVEVIP